MSEGSSVDRDDLPTRADVEAMKAWMGLGASGPLDGMGNERAYSRGRIVLPGPVEEAAREAEESARAREEHHAESKARTMRAIGGSLGLSHAVGSGPWASSMRARPSPDDAGGEDAGEAGSG